MLNFSLSFKIEDTLLSDYVDQQIEKAKENGDILNPKTKTSINGLGGYTFTAQGLGIHKYTYLQSPDKTWTVKIIDSTNDPSDQGFEETVNKILSTFKFTDDSKSSQSYTKTVTNIAHKDLAFKSFKLTYPASLELKINDTIINENNHVNETGSMFLILSKEKSSLELASSAFGGGACLFPGEEAGDWPFGKYGEFEDVQVDKSGIWRRSKSLSQKRPENEMYAIYTICHKKDPNQNYFNAFTPVGAIVYKIYTGEEDLIAKFDQVIKNIIILQ